MFTEIIYSGGYLRFGAVRKGRSHFRDFHLTPFLYAFVTLSTPSIPWNTQVMFHAIPSHLISLIPFRTFCESVVSYLNPHRDQRLFPKFVCGHCGGDKYLTSTPCSFLPVFVNPPRWSLQVEGRTFWTTLCRSVHIRHTIVLAALSHYNLRPMIGFAWRTLWCCTFHM